MFSCCYLQALNELTKAFMPEPVFKYFCFWAPGFTWVYHIVKHDVWHKMAAGFIGWANSPFQIELGVASIGFGLVGKETLEEA